MTDHLHPREARTQSEIPRRSIGNSDDHVDVMAERIIADNLPIVATNDRLIGPFEDASDKMREARAEFERFILPFTLHTERRGSIEIRSSEQFYDTERELHIQLYDVSIDEDGRIYMRFRETAGDFPRRSWTHTTGSLAEAIETEHLRTKAEVNDRAEALLEQMASSADTEDTNV